MRIEVKVPQLPESIAEGTLVGWHRKVGEAVARDENLVDVETDKVVLELPAPQAGVLVEIRQGDGATVAGQEVVAVIDSDATAAAATSTAAATPTAAPADAAAGSPRATCWRRRAPRRAKRRRRRSWRAPRSPHRRHRPRPGRRPVVRNSACRCRGFASAWRSGSCNRSRLPRS